MSTVKYYLALVICFVSTVTAFSQSSTAKQIASWNSCEEISGILDVVGTKYSDPSNAATKLVILAGIPDGARVSSADKAVADAIQYLIQFHKIDQTNIKHGVFRSDVPRTTTLEFFVKGELAMTVRTKPGSRLCFGMGETFHR